MDIQFVNIDNRTFRNFDRKPIAISEEDQADTVIDNDDYGEYTEDIELNRQKLMTLQSALANNTKIDEDRLANWIATLHSALTDTYAKYKLNPTTSNLRIYYGYKAIADEYSQLLDDYFVSGEVK